MGALLVLAHGLLRVLAFGWFLIRLVILLITLPFAVVIAIFGGRSVGKHISAIMDRKLEARREIPQG